MDKHNKNNLVNAFAESMKTELPQLVQHNKSLLWSKSISDNEAVYVMLDAPPVNRTGEVMGVYYGKVLRTQPLKPGFHYSGQIEMKFPFKLHKKLFALFDPPYTISNMSYLRWVGVEYRRKMLYGNDDLTTYSINNLVPYAIEQIKDYVSLQGY